MYNIHTFKKLDKRVRITSRGEGMDTMQDRVILHADLNNFYASCECSRDMSIKDKPVAVCGSQEERHGIVLAKNYHAKAFGVSTGEAIWQAKQKCPDLVIVNPHYELYVKYSNLVRSIYLEYSNQVECMGMDECWIDISGRDMTIEKGTEIAHEIRERVKFETGLTISVGVSFNKIFAKLGSDMKKPDAVTVIPKERFKEIVWPLDASEMLGVGRATKKELDRYCITTIGRLAAMPEDFMIRHFGKIGLQLLCNARGEDRSPVMNAGVKIPAKSFGSAILASGVILSSPCFISSDTLSRMYFNSRFKVLEYFNGCPTNKIAVLHSCLLAPAFISGKIKSRLFGLNFTPSFSK